MPIFKAKNNTGSDSCLSDPRGGRVLLIPSDNAWHETSTTHETLEQCSAGINTLTDLGIEVDVIEDPTMPDIVEGVVQEGTDSTTFTVDRNATAAGNTDPILILLGGDGVASPSDDLVRTRLTQDSSAETVQLTLERNRAAVGYAYLSPAFHLGKIGETTIDLDAFLYFNGANHTGTTKQACLAFLAHEETVTLDTYLSVSAGLLAANTGGISFATTGNGTVEFGGSGAISAPGNPTWNFGAGQADFGGNLDANAGLDVGGANLSFTADTGFGDWTFGFANGTLLQTGLGQVTFTGNVDAGLGLDVTGADLIFTDTSADTWTFSFTTGGLAQTSTGQVSFAGNVDATNGLDVTTAALTADAGLTLTTLGITMTGLDIGTGIARIGDIYCGTLDATTITGAVAADGTDDASWIINENAAATEVEDDILRMRMGRGAGGATVQEFRMWVDHDAAGVAGSYTGELFFSYAPDNGAGFTNLLSIDGATGDIDLITCAAFTSTANPTWDFGTGQADFGGNLDANAGLDVSGADFTFASVAGSFSFVQATNAITQVGLGQVTFSGNVDMTAGLDMTTGDFIFNGAAGTLSLVQATDAITQTGAGVVTFSGSVDATAGLHVTGATLTAAFDAGFLFNCSGTGQFNFGSSGAVTATGNPDWNFGSGAAEFDGLVSIILGTAQTNPALFINQTDPNDANPRNVVNMLHNNTGTGLINGIRMSLATGGPAGSATAFDFEGEEAAAMGVTTFTVSGYINVLVDGTPLVIPVGTWA